MAIQEVSEKTQKRKPPAKAKPRTMAKSAPRTVKYGDAPVAKPARKRKSTFMQALTIATFTWHAVKAVFVLAYKAALTAAILLLVAIFIAPTLMANALPSAIQIYLHGWFYDAAIDFTFALRVATVVYLIAAPIFAEYTKGALRWGFIASCVAVAVFNWANATETGQKVRTAAAASVVSAKGGKDAVRGLLADAQAELESLPAHKTVSQSAVDAMAANLATLRTEESTQCVKDGPLCKKVRAAIVTASNELTAATNDAATTKRSDGLKADIKKYKTQATETAGADLQEEDVIAARFAPIFAAIFGGDEASTEKTVSKYWSGFAAAIVEMMPALGPLGAFKLLMILLAVKREEEKAASVPAQPVVEKSENGKSPVSEIEKDVATIATITDIEPEKATEQENTVAAMVANPAIVLFKIEMLEIDDGSFVSSSTMWQAWLDYCAEREIEPGSQKAFGAALKALNVGWERNNNRPRYVGVMLKRHGLRVVK